MPLFVTFLHVLLCIALILIILLQPGKDSASVFGGGGGGNQMYGPRGQANLLGRATTVVATLFMVTSITLALYSSERAQQGSNIEEEILRLEREGGYNSKAEEASVEPPPEEADRVPTLPASGDVPESGEDPSTAPGIPVENTDPEGASGG
jgi:preprotein translocase subunit SecG